MAKKVSILTKGKNSKTPSPVKPVKQKLTKAEKAAEAALRLQPGEDPHAWMVRRGFYNR